MGDVVNEEALGALSGRRVLVTGHTGFKGSWLCVALEELGAKVGGYALAPEKGSHFERLGLESLIAHVEGDVRDLETLCRVMDAQQPEVVFHLAAQSLVRRSYDEPVTTFATNVMGTVNVLEAVRRSKSVKAVVIVTSDKCYENRGWEWGYRENDGLGGHDPYSSSKAAAEIAAAAYASSFFGARLDLGAATARGGNVIGGGDWAEDRILPDCVRALSRGEAIVVRNPAATRPWQHVLDCLSGYLLLGARLLADPRRYSGAWNFGPDERDIRTVEDLARTAIAAWGSGVLTVGAKDATRHEAHALHLNCDKAHRLLGWRPRWDFDRAVREAVGWYDAARTAPSVLDLTRGQIRRYLADASH